MDTPPSYPPLKSPPRLKENEAPNNHPSVVFDLPEVKNKRHQTQPGTPPKKYALLDKFLKLLWFSIQVLPYRGSVPTFTNIKLLIESLAPRRRFTYTHLAQLKFIFPELIDCVCDEQDLRVDLKSDNLTLIQLRKLFRIRLLTFYKHNHEDVDIPTPTVVIDQDTNPDATILQVSFSGSIGGLIHTVKALQDLGLNLAKQSISTQGSVIKTELFVTQLSTGRKLKDPNLLENMKLTVISNLLKYMMCYEITSESSSQLATVEDFSLPSPVKKIDVDIAATHIHVKNDGPKSSLLYIETENRPEARFQIVKILKDDNITIESAEIVTQGLLVKDKFHVSHNGEALNDSLSQTLAGIDELPML